MILIRIKYKFNFTKSLFSVNEQLIGSNLDSSSDTKFHSVTDSEYWNVGALIFIPTLFVIGLNFTSGKYLSKFEIGKWNVTKSPV